MATLRLQATASPRPDDVIKISPAGVETLRSGRIRIPPRNTEYDEQKAFLRKEKDKEILRQRKLKTEKELQDLRKALYYTDQVKGDLTKLSPEKMLETRGQLMRHGYDLGRLPHERYLGDQSQLLKTFDNYLRYGKPEASPSLPAPWTQTIEVAAKTLPPKPSAVSVLKGLAGGAMKNIALTPAFEFMNPSSLNAGATYSEYTEEELKELNKRSKAKREEEEKNLAKLNEYLKLIEGKK